MFNLLRRNISKIAIGTIILTNFNPCFHMIDEIIKKNKILDELNNRYKKDNKYHNNSKEEIFELYKKNSNIDINRLICFSKNRLIAILNIPTYILFAPFKLYKDYINSEKYVYTYYYNNDNILSELKLKYIMHFRSYKEKYTIRAVRDHYIYNVKDGISCNYIYDINGINNIELKKEEIIFYNMGFKKNGIDKIYYDNGNIKRECLYKDGKLNGEFKQYYENEQLQLYCSYIDNKKNGEFKEYYENKKLKLVGMYINGKINGEYKEYHENEQLKCSYTYIDDKINGEYKEYYENKKLKLVGMYINGKINGEYKEYYENEQLKCSYTYIDDNRNGEYKKYYKNGKLNIICSYINDKVNGEYKEYHMNEKLHIICTNNNNNLECKSYNENGEEYIMNSSYKSFISYLYEK
jgi:hypothetical protein